ncbi:MAG: AbrB/MazE/SpoVT family DNA-binding domain-containing protein [Bacillota bacterium]
MGVRASIDDRGRLFIPSDVRKQTGLRESDSVVVEAMGPGEFRVVRLQNLVDRSKGMYRHLRREGESMVDGLIEDRKREVGDEMK